MALVDAESASTKEAVKVAQEALSRAQEVPSRAIVDYKKFEDFKKEILEGSDEAYWIRYGDSRDAVAELYLDLDISSITISALEERAIEAAPTVEETALTEETTLASIEVESAIVEVREIEAVAVIKATALEVAGEAKG